MKPSGLSLSCDLSKATIFTAHLSCLCKLKEKMEKQRYLSQINFSDGAWIYTWTQSK